VKEIVILSGKGGTGKTSVVASFASLTRDAVMVDCDVDAADLHLVLNPQVEEENEFWSGEVAYIDSEKCNECGLCQELCRFDAIKNFKVDPVSCEGCGFCAHICPLGAVDMRQTMAGHWFVSRSKYGTLVHAKLGIAQENSGKLVSVVRQHARTIAEKENVKYIISDGPPGIGCPVISSLSGAEAALVVTEPTLSGIHDLERVLDVCRHFGIPSAVCVNKYDLNDENTQRIQDYCSDQGVAFAGKIPFDNIVIEALIHKLPVVEYSPECTVSREIERVWQFITG
jgi:MinD superfamily P-loop ATPase